MAPEERNAFLIMLELGEETRWINTEEMGTEENISAAKHQEAGQMVEMKDLAPEPGTDTLKNRDNEQKLTEGVSEELKGGLCKEIIEEMVKPGTDDTGPDTRSEQPMQPQTNQDVGTPMRQPRTDMTCLTGLYAQRSPAQKGKGQAQPETPQVSTTKHRDLFHYDSILPKDPIVRNTKNIDALRERDKLEEEDAKGFEFTEEADSKANEEKWKDEDSVHHVAGLQQYLGDNVRKKHGSDKNGELDRDGFKKFSVMLVKLKEIARSSSSLKLIRMLEWHLIHCLVSKTYQGFTCRYTKPHIAVDIKCDQKSSRSWDPGTEKRRSLTQTKTCARSLRW